jgi:putative transposase
MEEIKLFKNKYRIASTRLKYYDYSEPGAYYVTICTKNRAHIFGEIKDHKIFLSWPGCIVHKCWRDLPNHYPNCILDEFIVMPNHIHGIITLTNIPPVETGFKPVSNQCTQTTVTQVETGLKPVSTKPIKRHSLSEIIRGFKTFSARKINEYQKTTGRQLWQTRFYEHIIREETKINQIRNYISHNPAMWSRDRNNM